MITSPRHRFRFSLRTLFVLVTVVGLAAPTFARQYRAWIAGHMIDDFIHAARARALVITAQPSLQFEPLPPSQ